MGIINRDRNITEQRADLLCAVEPMVTGVTYLLASIPFAGAIEQMVVNARGLSGSPVINPVIFRFNIGLGVTAIVGIGNTLTVTEYGTSGPVGVSLTTPGSSLLNVLPGDILAMVTGTANTAADSVAISFVVRATEDFKSHYGVSGMIGFYPDPS